MNKGLEIINVKLKDKENKFGRQVVNGLGETLFIIEKEELDIIETELKRLEKIDNPKIVGTTTISKAFEGFLIKQCPDVEKKLKALEIIKEKQVNVGALYELDLKLYNKYVKEINGTPTLTKKEYDLLKEVLL